MIALIEGIVRKARHDSRRVDLASQTAEQTWINHALITVILGGGIGATIGWLLVTPAFGFRVGLLVALLAYLYREVEQWRGRRDKPAGWWFDAVMDVLVPLWVCSPLLLDELAFYGLTLCVAGMHFMLRPVE